MTIRVLRAITIALAGFACLLPGSAASQDEDPPPPSITSIGATPNPVQLPGDYELEVVVNRPTYATGYRVVIVNDDTGAVEKTCSSSQGTTCTHSLHAGWELNENPQPRHYHAEVRHTASGHVVSQSSQVTVAFDQTLFPVELSFPSAPTGSGATTQWGALAQTQRTVSYTPYAIRIEDSSGNVLAACGYNTSCQANLGPGTYRATVQDPDGPSLGRSSWWTLTPGEPPQEERADDLDLLALAALFASASEVCDLVLTYPAATNVTQPPSTLSDQTRACEAAEASGASITALLRAIAAAGGGTAVLWYLDEQRSVDQSDDDGEEPEPTPVPPGVWPDTLDADVDQFMAQNPNLESRATAQTLLKRCYRLTQRGGLSDSTCRELPIFVSGDLDVPEPTRHDYESILRRPQWVQLNYRAKEDSPGPAGWYSSDRRCAGSSQTVHCHEYPFFSTQQGGGTAVPRPRLKLVTSGQNLSQGGKLNVFYGRCGLKTTGRPFLSVPAPRGSNIPTLPLCNGHS